MRSLSVVMAYYDQPEMMTRQLDQFRSLDDELRRYVELIVVDDGSPRYPLNLDVRRSVVGEFNHDVQVHRMDVDVRWNQDACRNLGVHRARNEWVLLTDLDHLIPEATLRSVLTRDLSDAWIYKFARVNDKTLDAYKPHPNSWLMTKKMYWRAGGYDERFAGYYGTDWDFRDRCLLAAAGIHQLEVPLIRVGREHTVDASMPREFGRKSPADAQAIRQLKAQRERNKEKPMHFQFPNHPVLVWP